MLEYAINALKTEIIEIKYDLRLFPEPRAKKTITTMKKHIEDLQQAIKLLEKADTKYLNREEVGKIVARITDHMLYEEEGVTAICNLAYDEDKPDEIVIAEGLFDEIKLIRELNKPDIVEIKFDKLNCITYFNKKLMMRLKKTKTIRLKIDCYDKEGNIINN